MGILAAANSAPTEEQAVFAPSHWYAAYTQPRHERAVQERLETKAIEAFVPTATVESRWKDRRVRLQTPVFPGYVFVRIPLHARGRVLSVPGVVRILSFNGAPAPIHESEMEAVRLCLQRGDVPEPHAFVAVGEQVRVRDGALAGLCGLVTRRKGGCRLVVSIALIHQAISVEIDAALLEPLGTSVRCEEQAIKTSGSLTFAAQHGL